jgi:hypothetical protein
VSMKFAKSFIAQILSDKDYVRVRAANAVLVTKVHALVESYGKDAHGSIG